MTSDPEFTFRPLAEGDLPLLHRWLNNPEVARWYPMDGPGTDHPFLAQIIEHYGPRMRGGEGTDPTDCYVMLADGKPMGYIQCYRIGDHPEYAAEIDHDDDAWATDLFIGEDDFRNRGMGATILRAFIRDEILTRPGVETLMINPVPENARAIRCYEKAGFRHVKTVWVQSEESYEYVMTQTRAEFEAAS